MDLQYFKLILSNIKAIAFITWIKNEQSVLANSVKPDKDCTGYSSITLEQAKTDSALGDQAQGLLECYCRADPQRQIKISECVEWAFNRYLSISLPFIIVFAIIITNFIMQFVFRSLAAFEHHFYETTKMSSKAIKIFIAQFLNTVDIFENFLKFRLLSSWS